MDPLATSPKRTAWHRQQLRAVKVRLRQATMLVSEGARFVVYQKGLINALERVGRDATSQKVILSALETAQERHIAQRDALIAELTLLSQPSAFPAASPRS